MFYCQLFLYCLILLEQKKLGGALSISWLVLAVPSTCEPPSSGFGQNQLSEI